MFLGNGGKSDSSEPEVCCTEVGREGSVRAAWGNGSTEDPTSRSQAGVGFEQYWCGVY